MIRCLRVRNFKVFEEFGLENLRSINLITGKNNVGKTTLLEAIWAFIGRSNPQTFNQISLFHGALPVYTPFISQPLPIVEIHWAPNFTNFDLSRQIEVSVVRDDTVFDTKRHAVQNGSARNEGKGVGLEGKGVGLEAKNTSEQGWERLEIRFLAEAQIQEPVIPNSPALLAPTRQAIPSYTELIARPWSVGTLLFHYSPAAPNQTEEKPQELRVVLLGSMLQQTGALTDDRWRAALLLMNTQEHPDVLARSFGELDAKNQVGRLVEYLQQLEPRLRRLSLIPVRGVPLIHGDIGLSSPIPINYMGEGMNSLLAILLFMMAPHSVILVDEIGSGIHHTFLPRMWKLLSEVAQENSCQLFCTTHSYECIQAAVEGLAKSEQAQNMFRYIRLEQDTDAERTKIFPVVLEYNDLAPAVENGFEVR